MEEPSSLARSQQPAEPALLPEEALSLSRRIRASRSDATWKAYSSDWADFCQFCAGAGRQPLPASPETVCLYLEDLAGRGKAMATLARRLAALSVRHKGEGLATPTEAEMVRSVLAGLRRSFGSSQARKRPLRLPEIRQGVARSGDSLAVLRERAIVLLGYAGAFRRSELSQLAVGDLEWRAEGLAVHVRRSKTDQEARGMTKGLLYGINPHTCPLRALRSWLDGAGISEGPVFRALKKGGGVSSHRLSGTSISAIVKGFCAKAGLDPEEMGSHSLRAGFVTDCYAAGASEPAIMDQTGHRSREVLAMYRREASLFKNASSLLGL